MSIDKHKRIVEFQEKPSEPFPIPDDADKALVSMGIYVFSMDKLASELHADHGCADSSHDFGKDLIPRMIKTHKVYAYRFGGLRGRVTPDRYWRDVGTIDAYYEANMDLLKPVPPLDLYQADWAIRTYHSQSPPARMVPSESGMDGLLTNSILGSGTVILGGIVRHSVLSSRVRVEEGAVVEESLLFDHVIVGSGARLRRCIIDKGVEIPPGEQIGFDEARDRERFSLSEKGVIVVPKGYRFD